MLKEREYVEKALRKHTVSVEAYEKSLPEKYIQESLGPLLERLAVFQRATVRAALKALAVAPTVADKVRKKVG